MTALKSLQGLVCKELKFQPLQELWEGAKVSFDSNQYSVAIEDLTAAVAEIEESVLAVALLKRAVAFGCQGKLTQGIQDAFRAMNLAPSLLEGYLCAGSLLRLAGEKPKAAAVYRRGLNAVSGQCSAYEQLIREERAIKDQIHQENTRFFRIFPFELQAYIFGDLLSFDDRLQCMFTCHSWEDFFLDTLPQLSRHLAVGHMPQRYIDRILTSFKTRHNQNLTVQGTQYRQVSILPEISTENFKHTLNLLSQDCWRGRIEVLDIHASLDRLPNMKPTFEELLKQNSGSFKKLSIMCISYPKLALEVLNACPQLSHLVVSGHSSNPDTDSPFLYTSSGALISNRKLMSQKYRKYNRNTAGIIGNTVYPQIPASANPIYAAASESRAEHLEVMASKDPHNSPLALKRLDIIGAGTAFLFIPSFWKRLTNLEQINIMNLALDLNKQEMILRFIDEHCPKLKAFRFGSGRKHPVYNQNDAISTAEENQEDGLSEFIMRCPRSCRDAFIIDAATLVPSMFSVVKSGNVLTKLHLQLETVGLNSLRTFTSMYLPRLNEFQLDQLAPAPYYNIQQEHFAPISKNFPALQKIVLNGVYASDDALFELSKAKKLRYVHLKVLLYGDLDQQPMLAPPQAPQLQHATLPQAQIDAERQAALQAHLMSRTQAHLEAQLQMQIHSEARPLMHAQMEAHLEARRAAQQRHLALVQRQQVALQHAAGTGRSGIPFQHNFNTFTNHQRTHYVYSKFVNSCTNLTEVCLAGSQLKDSDLQALVLTNVNLSTVTVVGCTLLTNDGIVSAFNCHSVSPPSNIRQINLVNLNLEVDHVVSNLSKLPSLNKLRIINCHALYSNDPCIASRLQYSLSRQTSLNVYHLKTLTDDDGLLYTCIPGQHSVIIRTLSNLTILKPLVDFL